MKNLQGSLSFLIVLIICSFLIIIAGNCKNEKQASDETKIAVKGNVNKNDSIFLKELSGEWKSFDSVKNPMPDMDKPVEAPIYEEPVNYEFGSKNYPGIMPGEIFITWISGNYYFDENMIEHSFPRYTPFVLDYNFQQIGWKTKRMGGGIAYNTAGKVVEGARPVFINENEYLNERKAFKY